MVCVGRGGGGGGAEEGASRVAARAVQGRCGPAATGPCGLSGLVAVFVAGPADEAVPGTAAARRTSLIVIADDIAAATAEEGTASEAAARCSNARGKGKSATIASQ